MPLFKIPFFQDSPDLNYLVTFDCSEDTTYVVCLDNNQTSEEVQEDAGIDEEEESTDQQICSSSIISPPAAGRVSSIITVAGRNKWIVKDSSIFPMSDLLVNSLVCIQIGPLQTRVRSYKG